MLIFFLFLFFFNDTATTEIYTLSLHDALPISTASPPSSGRWPTRKPNPSSAATPRAIDRKITRLNSSHVESSYAVFCLKKKNSDYALQKYRWLTSLKMSKQQVRHEAKDSDGILPVKRKLPQIHRVIARTTILSDPTKVTLAEATPTISLTA